MNQNRLLTTATAAAATVAALSPLAMPPALHAAAATATTPARPNILIILADDLGYGDTSFTGCKDIRTPNLQRFAENALRLDNFHVCPISSPTRAGLMTGRWPIRYGLMKAVIPPWSKYGLPSTEKILPQYLAQAGYEDRAILGKWHLGHHRTSFLPANRGFTTFYGHYNGAIDYFTHIREGQTDWHRDTPGASRTIKEPGYTTDLLAADAVRFIEKDHAGKPWLLYLAFNAPHSPLQAKPEDLVPYTTIKGQRKTYAAMVDSLDQNIGRVLAAIDKLPDAANTLVLFFSDNGGVLPYSRNLPYRDGKYSVYEGGIRVPAAIRWPAAGLTGGKTTNALVGYIDIVPTLLAAAGLPPPAGKNKLDGIDILPILRNAAPAPARPWFSYYAQSGAAASVIENNWKLVAHAGDVLNPGKTAKTRYELYDLAKDPSEKTDLTQTHPDEVKRLKTRLAEFGRYEVRGVGGYNDNHKGFVAPLDWLIKNDDD